jgi:hypothetical protein
MLKAKVVPSHEKEFFDGTGLRNIAREYYVVKTLCKRLALVELQLYRAKRLCRAWTQALVKSSECAVSCHQVNGIACKRSTTPETVTCPYQEALIFLFRQIADADTASEFLKEIERVGADATCLDTLHRFGPDREAVETSENFSGPTRIGARPGERVRSPAIDAAKRGAYGLYNSRPAQGCSTRAMPQPDSSGNENSGPTMECFPSASASEAARRPLRARPSVFQRPDALYDAATLPPHARASAEHPEKVASPEKTIDGYSDPLMQALMETEQDALVGSLEQERLQTQLKLLRGVMAELEVFLEDCPCEASDGDLASHPRDDEREDSR